MRNVGALFGLVLACCSGREWAQTPVPPGPAAPVPVHAPQLRLTVEVTDKAGHPITGLEESDFTVLDERNPTPIRFFYAHDNALAEPGAESIILLIDDVNVDFNEVSFERDQIENFLRSNKGRLPAPLSIVLMSEKELAQIVKPSADGNLLADQFHQWQGHPRPVPSTADWGTQERWQDSQQALEKILRFEARQPGRKLLIWIGPGWSLFDSPDMQIDDREQRTWMDMVVNASARLNETQVTLYAVDPLGMTDGAGLDASRWEAFLKPVRKFDQALIGDLALQVLATKSGGQVLYSSNDLAGELLRCANDGSAWYTLALAAQTSEKPNTWHDLQVKVAKPGVVVRTTYGYYAQPQQ